jgi:hypothetical protein
MHSGETSTPVMKVFKVKVKSDSSLDKPKTQLVECLRFFWNKFYFFHRLKKKQNLEIVCVHIILFLSFLFCVLAV